MSVLDMETPFLLYSGKDENVHVQVLMRYETIWLPQKVMAELFHTTPNNVSLHLKNIYSEGEGSCLNQELPRISR